MRVRPFFDVEPPKNVWNYVAGLTGMFFGWTIVVVQSLAKLERLQQRAAEGIERVDAATQALHEATVAVNNTVGAVEDAVRSMDRTTTWLQVVAILIAIGSVVVAVVALTTSH